MTKSLIIFEKVDVADKATGEVLGVLFNVERLSNKESEGNNDKGGNSGR